MKSLTVTIIVTLVLTSSTVVGMPHALDAGFQGSVATRSTPQRQTHYLLDRGLIETGPRGLSKRANVINVRTVQSSKIENDYEDDNDEDDEDDTCDNASESSEEGHRNTPNLHIPYKIGLNSSTATHSIKSKLPLQNSSNSAAQYYPKPEKSTKEPKPSNHQTEKEPSDHQPEKEKHHSASQKYDVSPDKYASPKKSDYASKGHGFAGSYTGYQGKATFFSQGGAAGACGKVHADSDYVVAIQSQMYEGGKFCGKTVLVTRKSTGKSIQCIAADECPGCPTDQSLDLSLAAFNALGKAEEGVFDIHWQVMS